MWKWLLRFNCTVKFSGFFTFSISSVTIIGVQPKNGSWQFQQIRLSPKVLNQPLSLKIPLIRLRYCLVMDQLFHNTLANTCFNPALSRYFDVPMTMRTSEGDFWWHKLSLLLFNFNLVADWLMYPTSDYEMIHWTANK